MEPQILVPKRRDRLLTLVLLSLERVVDSVQGRPEPPFLSRRIVVLKSCCLGDLLLATPLVRAMRVAYPSAQLDVAVGEWARPAVTGNPDIERLVELESVGVGRFRLFSYLRAVRRLRAGKYDLAVVLDRSPLMTVLPLLARIPIRAGIDSGGRGWPLNVRVPWTIAEHETRLFLRIAAALGAETVDPRPRFSPTPEDAAEADRLWKDVGLDGRRVVALAPGGGRNPGMIMESKRWPIERFAALAERVETELSLALLIVGNADDRPVTRDLKARLHAPFVDITGCTSFGMLGAILQRCAAFVGNDSGPMHMAVAVGVPTVAIFGPTDPAVYAHVETYALALRGAKGISTDEVGVSEVFEAVRALTAEESLS